MTINLFKRNVRAVLLVATVLALAVPAAAQQRGGGGGFGGGFGGGGFGGGNRGNTTTRIYPGTGTVGDATFSVDADSRNVVVIGDEDTIKYVNQVLTDLDRPQAQVLIKVVFLEVTHTDASDIGFEGGVQKNINNGVTGTAQNGFGLSSLSALSTNVNAFGTPFTQFAPATAGAGTGAGIYQILGGDFQATLRAVASAGKSQVLSRPSVLARNNQPATIVVGQSVPLITSVRYDTLGNAINSVTYQDVGIILRVTPFIGSGGLVQMIVSPEISSVSTTQSQPISANVSAPYIDTQSADTVVVTPNGQTVIIGGLIQDDKSFTETKVPFLGDIPGLGNLFKHKIKSHNKQELLIFLTPYIVEAPDELAAVSDQERHSVLSPKSPAEKDLDRFLDKQPVRPPTKGGTPPNPPNP